MLTSLKSCRSPCTMHVTLSPCCRERRQEFIPPEMWPSSLPDLNPVDYSIWGILQERVCRSRIHDVKELKERLLSECRLLDHTIIAAAAIAQWCSRLSACVRNFAWVVHILNINFEPVTFCYVLFVSSILVSVNVIDINLCKVLILCEMCYFCVWHFHTVW